MKLVIVTGKTWKSSVRMGYILKTCMARYPLSLGRPPGGLSFVQTRSPPLTSSVLLGMLFTLVSLGLLVHTVELRMPRSQGYCADVNRRFISVSSLPNAHNVPAFLEPLF